MGSIPLAANNIQPPPNPMQELARIFQVKGLQQRQQLNQLAINRAQLESADDEKWRSAMQDPNWDGTPEQLLKNGLKQGVGPASYAKVAQGMAAMGEGFANLGSAQLKLQDALANHIGDQLQAVSDAKPQDKLAAQQQAKQNAITWITSTPGIHPAVRQQQLAGIQQIPDDQYVGDDAIQDLIARNKFHSAIVEEGLKKAQTAEASGKGAQAQAEAGLAQAKTPGAQAESTMQQQSAALTPQQRALSGNLPYAAATGVPGAQQALNLETEQKRQAAIAQVQAQAQQYSGNSALAKVPPHLVPAATSEATKLAIDYSAAKQAADSMSGFLSMAQSGNKEAVKMVPLQGALEITTAQGVHRINRTEVEQYGNAGSLFDKINGAVKGAVTGNNIPDNVLRDMQALQQVVAGNADSKYKNGLKAVNQNYGSNFAPVQMETTGSGASSGGPGAATGFTRIKASDGSLHDIPTQNLAKARQRDPGLQVQ